MNYPAIPSQGDESNKGSQNFQVCVRIRPLTTKEEQQTTKKFNSVISVQDNMLFLYDPNENSIKDIITNNQSIYNNPQSQHSRRPGKEFIFDHVFPEQTTTEELFNECVFPSVDHILNGYNSTIFAYGMTGAGKTHTIFGNLSSSNETEGQVCGGGIAVMMIQALLDKAKQLASQVNFKFSYLEIYNENIRDLMVIKSDNLMVIEDADKGVFVPDLTDYALEAADDIKRFITNGNTRRVMASTAANTFSSRSHAIIQILCEQINHGQNLSITSKLSIVDLAGSERAASTENRGLRLTEGANINRSLLALGNCINLLSDATKKGSFVPYRDSKLTRLLKESLGGNTRSTMLACVSPSCLCYDETLNTLKYATRAKFIKKTVSKNSAEMSQHVDQYKSIIAGLRTEIVNLKQQLSDTHQENISLKNQHKIISQYNSNNSNDSSGSSHYKNIIPGSSSSRNSDRNKATKSVDEIGELLIDNLEEQWEIKNTISEIINLNKCSEEYIFEQEERSKRQALTDQQRREITNEISKRREVINSNEQILAEMNQKLQENAAKKKELQIMMQQTAAGQTDREYMNQPFSIDVDVKSATIQQLHEQVMRMQEELQHKDQLLKQKQLIIQDLTAKEPGERQTAGRGTIQQGQAAKKKGISISNNSSAVYTDKSTGNIIPNNNQPSSSSTSSILNQRQPPSGSSSSSNSQSSSIQSSSQQPNKDNNNARKFYLKIPKEMISERASSKNHFTNNSSTVSVSSCTSQANSSGLQISNNIKDLKRPMSINNAKNNRSNNNNNYTPAGTTVSSNNHIDSNPGQSWGEYDSCADDDGNRLHRKIRDASVKVPHKDNNNNNSTYLKAKIARNNYQNSQENQQVQSQRRPATSKITNNSTSSSSARSEAIQSKNNLTQKEPRERHSSTRKTTSNLSTNVTSTTNHTLSTQQSTGKTTNVVTVTCSNNSNDNNNNSGFKQQTPRAVGLFNVSDIQLPTSHSNSAHTMEISLLELKQHAQKLKDADLNDKQELRLQEGLNLDDLESYQIVEKRDQSSASNLNNILNGQQQQNSQCSSLVDVQMIMRRLNQKVDERIAASSAMIGDEQAKKNTQIDWNYCSNSSYQYNNNNNSSNFTENCQQNNKNIQNSRTTWNCGSNNNIDMQLNQQQPYLDGNINEKPLVQGYERSTRQSHREEADCQILNYPQTNTNCKQVFQINSQQQQGQQQQIALNKSNRSASCLKLCGGNDYELNSYALARKKARELKQKGNNIMDENSSKIYFEGEINNVLNGLSAQNQDNNSSNYNNNNNKGSQLQQLLNNGISNQQNNIQNSNIYYEQIHQGDQQSQLFSSSTIVSARRNIQSEDIMISNENSQPGSTSSAIGNSNVTKQIQNRNINVDGGVKKIPGMSQNSVNSSSNRNTPNGNGNSSYVQQQQMRLEKQRGENPCLKNISNNFSQLPPTTTGSPGMNSAVNNSNKMQNSQVPRRLLSQFNVNYAETLNYSKKTAMIANGGSSKSNNSQRNSVRQRDNSPKTAKNRGTSKSYLQQDTFSGNSSQSNEVIDFQNQLVLQSSRRTEPTEGYFNEYRQGQLQQQQQESAFVCQYSSQSSLNYV